MITLAVDVGGTHTDLYGWDESKTIQLQEKVETTPDDPTEGILNAVEKADIDLEDVATFMHGSTISTNAIIEGTYPTTPFITTEGFRDLLEIGRYHREELYDPYQEKPDPLVKGRQRYEVPGRINEAGEVTEELDEEAVYQIADQLKTEGVRSAAVGFINSYINPEHERRVKEILEAELDDPYIGLSSDVSRKLGSMARFNSAIMNAALEPIMKDYLDRLERKLDEKNFDGRLFVIRSDGGVAQTVKAVNQAEMTILSGPAAGVKGCQIVGDSTKQSNVIGMDMGGTSTDVSLIENNEPLFTTEYEVKFDIPLMQPMLDVTTIGSGGGSIAWVDDGGSLRVGPRSAGAKPGPVCYDYGGTEPTITDANLVLGRLDPETFLGGSKDLNVEAAHGAIEELADELGIGTLETAEGILRIAHENMAAAVREVTIERGRDPRDFYLVGFGGCGPMHTASVAESLGISTFILPTSSGVLSALGGTMMDLRHNEDKTFYSPAASVDPDSLVAEFQKIEDSIAEQFRQEGVDAAEVSPDRIAEMRYIGQTYNVDVPVPNGELTQEDIDTIVEKFHDLHRKEYGVASEEFPVTFVNLRVAGVAGTGKSEVPKSTERATSEGHNGTRDVFYEGEWHETNIYYRQNLAPDTVVEGPAIIEGDHSTIVLNPDNAATVDAYENIIVDA